MGFLGVDVGVDRLGRGSDDVVERASQRPYCGGRLAQGLKGGPKFLDGWNARPLIGGFGHRSDDSVPLDRGDAGGAKLEEQDFTLRNDDFVLVQPRRGTAPA